MTPYFQEENPTSKPSWFTQNSVQKGRTRTWHFLSSSISGYQIPLRVTLAGLHRWPKDGAYSRKKSDVFGIELVTAGNIVFSVDGKEYLVEKGGVFLKRKGTRHSYATGPAGFAHKKSINMDGFILDSLLQAFFLTQANHLVLSNPGAIHLMVRKILRALSESSPDQDIILSSLCYELLVRLGREAAKQPYPAEVLKALEFMQANLFRPITAEEAAGASGLSLSHFNRIFRKYLNTSPAQYFQEQKIVLARGLLKETTLSVQGVAAKLGYEDPFYFSTQFKRKVGESPKQYRDLFLENNA